MIIIYGLEFGAGYRVSGIKTAILWEDWTDLSWAPQGGSSAPTDSS
jgi:hypothetical protein